jgi:hypothetical protein
MSRMLMADDDPHASADTRIPGAEVESRIRRPTGGGEWGVPVRASLVMYPAATDFTQQRRDLHLAVDWAELVVTPTPAARRLRGPYPFCGDEPCTCLITQRPSRFSQTMVIR